MKLAIDYYWMGQVFTALLITSGAVLIGYQVREFHRRGMERVRRGNE